MIRITIELIPLGILPVEDKWVAEIRNDGTGSDNLGNYDWVIYRKNSTSSVWQYDKLSRFHRKSHGVWFLVYLCLRQLFSGVQNSALPKRR